MDAVVGVILNNLRGFTFDTVIIIIGAVNWIVLVFTWQNAKEVHKNFDGRHNKSLPRFNPRELSEDEMRDLYDKLYCPWKRAEKLYSIFIGLTSIFPYLGILGTVISLMMLVGSDVSYAAQESFYVALTSTFWGVLFAVFFRVFDAAISTTIQSNNDDMVRLIHHEGKKQHPIEHDEA